MDHLAVVALTLLVGGSVIALVGQHGSTGRPGHRAEPAAGRTGGRPVLYCLQDLVQRCRRPRACMVLLATSWGRGGWRAGRALLLELVATTAGVAQSMAHHVHAVLAADGLRPATGCRNR
jgi:hypothetical protein